MDNHPIPQDITGFQFKLIGNMTVRQFVYLAVGAILAWLFFFMLGLPTIIKWPLAIFCIGGGAIFAFVPIDGRPMDTMLSNFIRAILAPTQFIYQKEGMKMENQTIPHSQPLHLPHLHVSLPHHSNSNSSEPQAQTVSQNFSMPVPAPVPQPAPVQAAAPTPAPNPAPAMQPIQPTPQPQPIPNVVPTMTIEPIGEPEDIRKKNNELRDLEDNNKKLEKELEELKKQLEEAKKAKEEALAAQAPAPQPVAPPVPQLTPEQQELQRKLVEAEREKVALQQQILQQQAKAQSPTQGVTPVITSAPQANQRVRSVPQGMEKSVGIPSVPEAPNLITGIVKDPRGNPLQNILIEVKDQDSNPVRAFKTNGLGKFASATSLSNGKYLIAFEDPKETNKFDAVEIELVGAPVLPLEIISVDPREELRRELFN